MGTEQLKVLEMVAAGTLSVEQGNQLLSALGGDRAPESRERRPQSRGGGRQESRGDWKGESGAGLTPENLVRLRNHGVNAAFLKEMRDAGFADLSLEQLSKMALHGMTAAYVEEMRGLGFGDLTPEQLTKMRMHGLDAAYVEEMRALGFRDLTVDQLIKMRMHGVDAAYVQEMRDLGFDNLGPEQRGTEKLQEDDAGSSTASSAQGA